MESVLRDFRYGLRSLIKSPGLTIVATLALTLGIGVTVTMFSIVYGALMKGLPFPDGNRIVEVRHENPSLNRHRMNVPISDYEDYRAQQHTLEPIAAYYSGTVNVSGTGDAERYMGAWVTATTFDIARVRPLLGQTIHPGDDTPAGGKVAVISYKMWQRRFGGDSSAIGQVIRANAAPFTIVGVMPEGFVFPDNADLWLPLQVDPLAMKRGDGQYLTVIGKLKPGLTAAQAAIDLNAIDRRLQTQYKETNEGISSTVESFVDAEIGPEPHQLLYTMLGAVLFVLLIACANVANLLLDRAAHKTREVGIRTALGASRAAVVRQFLTEALVLSAAGAVLGTALAQAGITAFNRILVDTQAPFFIDIRLHPPMALTTPVRQAIASLNPDLPIYWVYSMEEAIARPTWYIRTFGTMFMIFGAIALFLASVGLYAVMSFSVSRRTREVGIRMALGAQGGDVIRMIFRQGVWQLGIGMTLGLALAAGVAQFVRVILFQVEPRDPAIFGGVVLVLSVAGLLACLVPARRATRVDPLVALRAE